MLALRLLEFGAAGDHQTGCSAKIPAKRACTALRRHGIRPPRHGELFRLYLREMGVEPELLDIVDRNWEAGRATELPPSEWARLRIVTDSP